jgi:hypothetical protein
LLILFQVGSEGRKNEVKFSSKKKVEFSAKKTLRIHHCFQTVAEGKVEGFLFSKIFFKFYQEFNFWLGMFKDKLLHLVD